MFEKLKNHLKNYEPASYTSWQVIGLLILIFMLVLAYSAGRWDGYKPAQAEVPQLKLVLDNRACAATLTQTSRSDEGKP